MKRGSVERRRQKEEEMDGKKKTEIIGKVLMYEDREKRRRLAIRRAERRIKG
jgi:hypothetical protein